jgi:hypothetical protein
VCIGCPIDLQKRIAERPASSGNVPWQFNRLRCARARGHVPVFGPRSATPARGWACPWGTSRGAKFVVGGSSMAGQTGRSENPRLVSYGGLSAAHRPEAHGCGIGEIGQWAPIAFDGRGRITRNRQLRARRRPVGGKNGVWRVGTAGPAPWRLVARA